MECQPGVHPDLDIVRAASRRTRAGEHERVIEELAECAIPAHDVASRAATVPHWPKRL